jgi:hypothetical protein
MKQKSARIAAWINNAGLYVALATWAGHTCNTRRIKQILFKAAVRMKRAGMSKTWGRWQKNGSEVRRFAVMDASRRRRAGQILMRALWRASGSSLLAWGRYAKWAKYLRHWSSHFLRRVILFQLWRVLSFWHIKATKRRKFKAKLLLLVASECSRSSSELLRAWSAYVVLNARLLHVGRRLMLRWMDGEIRAHLRAWRLVAQTARISLAWQRISRWSRVRLLLRLLTIWRRSAQASRTEHERVQEHLIGLMVATIQRKVNGAFKNWRIATIAGVTLAAAAYDKVKVRLCQCLAVALERWRAWKRHIARCSLLSSVLIASTEHKEQELSLKISGIVVRAWHRSCHLLHWRATLANVLARVRASASKDSLLCLAWRKWVQIWFGLRKTLRFSSHHSEIIRQSVPKPAAASLSALSPQNMFGRASEQKRPKKRPVIERVVKYTYSKILDQWLTSEVQVLFGSRPFARGSCRDCYMVWEVHSSGTVGDTVMVAKIPLSLSLSDSERCTLSSDGQFPASNFSAATVSSSAKVSNLKPGSRVGSSSGDLEGVGRTLPSTSASFLPHFLPEVPPVSSSLETSLFTTAIIQVLAGEYADGFNGVSSGSPLFFMPMEILRLSDRSGECVSRTCTHGWARANTHI